MIKDKLVALQANVDECYNIPLVNLVITKEEIYLQRTNEFDIEFDEYDLRLSEIIEKIKEAIIEINKERKG